MARPRKRGNKNLPPNLYRRASGYYVWRDPLTGKFHGLGRCLGTAVAQAVEVNVALAELSPKRRLLDKISGRDDRAMSLWIARYRDEVLTKRERAKSTCASDAQKLRTLERHFGPMQVDAITTADIAEFLRTYEQAGKNRMAQAMRSLLFDLFREARGIGWAASNPVEPTRAAKVTVRRKRLELPEFLKIVEIAERDFDPWAANAFLLALVTGLRREDVAKLGPKHLVNPDGVRDERLWVVPAKTADHDVAVSYPLALRLQAVNLSINEVIKRCRSKHVLGRTFIHHTRHIGRVGPGSPVRPATITAAFAECRDKLGIDWGDRTPPTLHEIRSLAARLYEMQGTIAQSVLGHKTAETAALYQDRRELEWIMVRCPVVPSDGAKPAWTANVVLTEF